MPEDLDVKIRKFEPGDTQDVRQIIHDTALLGEPASLFFEGREVFSDALTLYFTDYEPQSCFVAVVNSKVIGCLIGAKNTVVLESVFNKRIVPRLFYKAIKSGIFLSKKNIIFILSCLWDAAGGRLIAPDFSGEYPAILHVNVNKVFRGLSIGSRLLSRYLDYLRQEGVKGVHLATMSEAGAGFFRKKGFKLLYTSKRSYFRPVLHRDVPLYVYGMKLA
ncbi:MAG: GNAT family N-acetyltransferase [Candidatus Omnitrophota bacterium]